MKFSIEVNMILSPKCKRSAASGVSERRVIVAQEWRICPPTSQGDAHYKDGYTTMEAGMVKLVDIGAIDVGIRG